MTNGSPVKGRKSSLDVPSNPPSPEEYEMFPLLAQPNGYKRSRSQSITPPGTGHRLQQALSTSITPTGGSKVFVTSPEGGIQGLGELDQDWSLPAPMLQPDFNQYPVHPTMYLQHQTGIIQPMPNYTTIDDLDPFLIQQHQQYQVPQFQHIPMPASREYPAVQEDGFDADEPDDEGEEAPMFPGVDILAFPAQDPNPDPTRIGVFPSYIDFNEEMVGYLMKLSDKKKEKALLSQKMYDEVLRVLHDPTDVKIGTAQFRFWVKKTFNLTTFGGDNIICQGDRPVAVKEQIYEVLIHCHAAAGHGGRDKTSTEVSLSEIRGEKIMLTVGTGQEVLLLDPEGHHLKIRQGLSDLSGKEDLLH
jgi:hypothetical protein